jgi:hypothetical protein
MKHLFSLMISALLLSTGLLAMEEMEIDDFNPKKHTHSRESWGAAAHRVKGYDKHTKFDSKNRLLKIIIGHTVTPEEHPEHLLRYIQSDHMSRTWSDIGYHRCLDVNGECYIGRPYEIIPALITGQNDGSCAVGLIGNFDAHPVSAKTARRWGTQLGQIAYELGYDELVQGENIFGMSDLSAKYDKSPGKNVMGIFNDIVNIANNYLKLQSK